MQRLKTIINKWARQWKWANAEGFGRWVEEHKANPVDRTHTAFKKWRWRQQHGVCRGEAVPVYLAGVQRSGTNMLVRGLEKAPEFEVHSENDRQAFVRYRLRSDQEIAAIILRSRHRFVLFKPLCDSHRVDYLLDTLSVPQHGRAIWAYRDVDARVRSALSKFGDVNLRVLREIAAGRGQGQWQSERLSERSLEHIRSFNYQSMTPATAAALFWYVRNSLYFDLGLNQREDTLLVSYDALVSAPEKNMQAICGFLNFAYSPSLVADVEARPNSRKPPLDIDPGVRKLCDRLTDAMDACARADLKKWSP